MKTIWRPIAIAATMAAILITSAIVVMTMGTANAVLPAGKTSAIVHAAKTFNNFHLRMAVAKGAAASTSIPFPGITSADAIIAAMYNDTTAANRDWADYSDSTYFQAADSVRCGTSTAGGYLWIFYNQAN